MHFNAHHLTGGKWAKRGQFIIIGGVAEFLYTTLTTWPTDSLCENNVRLTETRYFFEVASDESIIHYIRKHQCTPNLCLAHLSHKPHAYIYIYMLIWLTMRGGWFCPASSNVALSLSPEMTLAHAQCTLDVQSQLQLNLQALALPLPYQHKAWAGWGKTCALHVNVHVSYKLYQTTCVLYQRLNQGIKECSLEWSNDFVYQNAVTNEPVTTPWLQKIICIRSKTCLVCIEKTHVRG